MGVLDKITKRKVATKDTNGVVKKGTKKTSVKETKAKKSAGISKKALNILLGPVVSEKAANLGQKNVVVFKVSKGANRVAVRNAIRELYKVTPVRVNMLTVRGKWVRFGRFEGRQNTYKKAMVYLPEGTSLDIFEGV